MDNQIRLEQKQLRESAQAKQWVRLGFAVEFKEDREDTIVWTKKAFHQIPYSTLRMVMDYVMGRKLPDYVDRRLWKGFDTDGFLKE